jgi:hypothetical protein
MSEPQPGDLVLRGSLSDGFVVLDATTRQRLAGPVGLSDAITYAKERRSGRLWQEIVDDRGRPVGPVSRLALT